MCQSMYCSYQYLTYSLMCLFFAGWKRNCRLQHGHRILLRKKYAHLEQYAYPNLYNSPTLLFAFLPLSWHSNLHHFGLRYTLGSFMSLCLLRRMRHLYLNSVQVCANDMQRNIPYNIHVCMKCIPIFSHSVVYDT